MVLSTAGTARPWQLLSGWQGSAARSVRLPSNKVLLPRLNSSSHHDWPPDQPMGGRTGPTVWRGSSRPGSVRSGPGRAPSWLFGAVPCRAAAALTVRRAHSTAHSLPQDRSTATPFLGPGRTSRCSRGPRRGTGPKGQDKPFEGGRRHGRTGGTYTTLVYGHDDVSAKFSSARKLTDCGKVKRRMEFFGLAARENLKINQGKKRKKPKSGKMRANSRLRQLSLSEWP